MNWKVLSLEPGNIEPNFCTSKPLKKSTKMISRMDDKCSKVFNAKQSKFGTQWPNVAPCKHLGLKLDDQQLQISIGLRLGADICDAHTCYCGRRVEREGLHGLSCTVLSLLTSCYSQFSHRADVGIPRLAFNAGAAWTLPN